MEIRGAQIPKSTAPKHRRAMIVSMAVALVVIAFLVPFQIHFHRANDLWLGVPIALYLIALLVYLFKLASPRQIFWAIVGLVVAGVIGYFVGFYFAMHWSQGLSVSQLWHSMDDGFRK